MNPRLDRLRPYPFERLRALLEGASPPPALPHIALAIGEPRHAPLLFIAAELTRAPGTLGRYPLVAGLPNCAPRSRDGSNDASACRPPRSTRSPWCCR